MSIINFVFVLHCFPFPNSSVPGKSRFNICETFISRADSLFQLHILYDECDYSIVCSFEDLRNLLHSEILKIRDKNIPIAVLEVLTNHEFQYFKRHRLFPFIRKFPLSIQMEFADMPQIHMRWESEFVPQESSDGMFAAARCTSNANDVCHGQS